MNSRSHRYDKNRLKHGHGHKYTKYKIDPSIMMAICIKKNKDNI